MNSISRPELSLDWWKNTRPKSHGDKKLDNALGEGIDAAEIDGRRVREGTIGVQSHQSVTGLR